MQVDQFSQTSNAFLCLICTHTVKMRSRNEQVERFKKFLYEFIFSGKHMEEKGILSKTVSVPNVCSTQHFWGFLFYVAITTVVLN